MTPDRPGTGLQVTPDVAIAESELEEQFVRASGPGGQHVNKVATAVQLRFDAARSPALDDRMRLRLRTLAGARMTADGVVVIDARRYRTQARNREDARLRLADLLRRAAERPARRRGTKPSAGSKERRLKAKARRAEAKGRRGRVEADE
jgi:ribosome-associated protein